MDGKSGGKWRLRSAVDADWEPIAALLSEHHLPLAGAQENLENFVVAERDGAILGVGGIERYSSDGLLRSVAVAPIAQRCGIGHLIVDVLITVAREQKLKTLTLLTTTAEGYFPRFGFERIDRDSAPEAVKQSAEFRGACPSSAVVMLRRLGV